MKTFSVAFVTAMLAGAAFFVSSAQAFERVTIEVLVTLHTFRSTKHYLHGHRVNTGLVNKVESSFSFAVWHINKTLTPTDRPAAAQHLLILWPMPLVVPEISLSCNN